MSLEDDIAAILRSKRDVVIRISVERPESLEEGQVDLRSPLLKVDVTRTDGDGEKSACRTSEATGGAQLSSRLITRIEEIREAFEARDNPRQFLPVEVIPA